MRAVHEPVDKSCKKKILLENIRTSKNLASDFEEHRKILFKNNSQGKKVNKSFKIKLLRHSSEKSDTEMSEKILDYYLKWTGNEKWTKKDGNRKRKSEKRKNKQHEKKFLGPLIFNETRTKVIFCLYTSFRSFYASILCKTFQIVFFPYFHEYFIILSKNYVNESFLNYKKKERNK